jgi:enoyl-CoA hydratase/carnithine racemase
VDTSAMMGPGDGKWALCGNDEVTVMTEVVSALVPVTLDGNVLTVRMQRPEKRNALNVEMYAALATALRRANSDPAVRVVVITGGPDCFTAGNDILDFVGNPPADDTHPVMQFLFALTDFEKPLIAAVNGAAVGIGTTLLLHCDLAYAAEDARFHLPFVNLGLCPEAGSSLLLPMRAGSHRAAEAILLGQPFDAATALSWGLVNRLTAPGQADAAALEAAQRVAKQPPAAIRAARQLLREPLRLPLHDALRREAEAFVARLSSPEAAESFQAFMERRPPDFSPFS